MRNRTTFNYIRVITIRSTSTLTSTHKHVCSGSHLTHHQNYITQRTAWDIVRALSTTTQIAKDSIAMSPSTLPHKGSLHCFHHKRNWERWTQWKIQSIVLLVLRLKLPPYAAGRMPRDVRINYGQTSFLCTWLSHKLFPWVGTQQTQGR